VTLLTGSVFQLKSSTKHLGFKLHLHFASTHLIIKESESSLEDAHRYFPLRESFGKHLTTRSMSYNDEKLLLEVAEFVCLLLKFSADLDMSWAKYLIDIAATKNGVFFHSLARTNTEYGQPFLISKGHEKIGTLMLTLIARMSIERRKEIGKNFFENMIESRPTLNIWLLKVLAGLTLFEPGKSFEQNCVGQIMSIIVDQLRHLRLKSEVFDQCALHLWSAINLHNLVRRKFKVSFLLK